MFKRPWQKFFREKIEYMLAEKRALLDIGGGLRIDSARNNRIDQSHAWIMPMIRERGVAYKVLDYVDTYHPDVVGDVQDLPLPDDSQDAIVCNAILEHVENPIKAAAELYRVLKPGGLCFMYVPFLYYYHAEKGYYGDYWRFTDDGIRSICKPFASIELAPVRGPVEALVRLSPLGRLRFLCDMGFVLDRAFGKLSSKQVGGYYVFLRK
jgi:ubiquinone/menaquinone biosynthesis C-methylase UbiE